MKHIPARTCIVCRQEKPKQELVRIVRRADGTFAVDRTGREPGRGAYVCDNSDCKQKLIAKRVLSRVYKQNIDKAQYDALVVALGVTEDNGTAE